jgi:hypothetical protein
MRFRASIATAMVVLLAGNTQAAAAGARQNQDPIGKFFNGLGTFFGINGGPTVEGMRPRLSPPSGKVLDPTKFYKVKLTCRTRQNTSQLLSDGLILKEKTFVAHSLWLSPTSSSGAIPTDATKVVNVFAFQKGSDGTVEDFKNETCSDTFVISGKSGVLTVSVSVTTTNEPSTFASVVSGAAKMVVGIAPALLTGGLSTAITTAATAAGSAQDPLKTMIAALNGDPRRNVVARRLTASDRAMTIDTDFSHATLTVTEIPDLSKLVSSEPKFRLSFYQTFDTIAHDPLTGITSANSQARCAAVANTLQNSYSFGVKDRSFILGYVAQSAFPGTPDIATRILCIGNQSAALDVVNYDFIYNHDYGPLKAFTKTDVINAFSGQGFNGVRLNSELAYTFSTELSDTLAAYSQTPAGATKDAAWSDAAKVINASSIDVSSISNAIHLTTGSIATKDFVDKLNQAGFVRFGCFWVKPSVGFGGYDAIVLSFPLKAPAGRDGGIYELEDLIGLRIVADAIDGNSAALKKVQVTGDTAALLEAATQNKGRCYSARINIK